MSEAQQVTDNRAGSRFELTADGHLAELRYRINGNRLVLIHTGVPAELEGRGIGGTLVAAAVARAVRDSLTMVPLCPFARGWLQRHPDVAAQAAIDWGKGAEVELTVLAVPDCPNAPVLERRLAEVLAGRPGVRVRRRVVADAADAARWGMHGSPTLLVDGVDPFAAPGGEPAMACRLYRGEDGRLEAAPTVEALRRVLEQG